MGYLDNAFKALKTVLSLVLMAPTLLFAQNVGPNIDQPWQRSIPAGPYSKIDTAAGGLDTQIPLFNLSGLGQSSLSFAIRHRSNRQNGSSFLAGYRQPGAGWVHNWTASTTQQTGLDENIFGNSVGHWTINNVSGVNYFTRVSGCRADTAEVFSGAPTPQFLGVKSTHQADKSSWFYGKIFNRGTDTCMLTSVTDTHGNATNVSYDSSFGVTQVTDASGRFVVLNKNTNGTLSSVQLNAGGWTRQWDFSYDASNRLTQILFPPTVVGGARPHIDLVYDSNTNITDLYDLKGNHWHYGYATEPLFTNAVVCK